MSRCKAPENLQNKAYLNGTPLMWNEDNAADGRFSSVKKNMAERGGFEPPVACATPAFQASTIGLSVTSPQAGQDTLRVDGCKGFFKGVELH